MSATSPCAVNRQFPALQAWLRHLIARLDDPAFLPDADKSRARTLANRIAQTATVDELYRALGFRYVCDPGGLMRDLPSHRFRVIISRGVLEHIPADTASAFIRQNAALLAPNGVAIHGINIGDHLAQYDPRAHPKQYLAYSDRAWHRWFANDVQYINRLQRRDWHRLFADAGLRLMCERTDGCRTDGLRMHRKYADLSPDDIACTHLEIVAGHGCLSGCG